MHEYEKIASNIIATWELGRGGEVMELLAALPPIAAAYVAAAIAARGEHHAQRLARRLLVQLDMASEPSNGKVK